MSQDGRQGMPVECKQCISWLASHSVHSSAVPECTKMPISKCSRAHLWLCRANIKVSSTETGAIFGNLVYEGTGYADRAVVVLNDIHIDIMDYIAPATCTDVQFRSMWAEFEWENKVSGFSCCLLLLWCWQCIASVASSLAFHCSSCLRWPTSLYEA